jgi:RNA polymerase sigma-70 factor (ECF subfamily)
LERLCRTYWPPLYAFVRRSGYASEEAKDLTQAFFAFFLEQHTVARADQGRGRFRTFLLACLKNFLRDEWDRQSARKRGGMPGVTFVSWDESEALAVRAATESETPERAYERHWATVLLEQVMGRLEEESAQKDLFAELKPHLGQEEGSVPYVELAARWQTTEGALRLRVHRLRERYRDLLREEIAHTVGDASEIDQEIEHLVAVVSHA